MNIADFIQGFAVGFILATLFWMIIDTLYEIWQEVKRVANEG